eukprot:scaffold5299_cov18-Tisochrysis_lutea.AAC.1
MCRPSGRAQTSGRSRRAACSLRKEQVGGGWGWGAKGPGKRSWLKCCAVRRRGLAPPHCSFPRALTFLRRALGRVRLDAHDDALRALLRGRGQPRSRRGGRSEMTDRGS